MHSMMIMQTPISVHLGLKLSIMRAQLLLIVPFMRFGELMLHSPPMDTKPAALFDILFHNPGEWPWTILRTLLWDELQQSLLLASAA